MFDGVLIIRNNNKTECPCKTLDCTCTLNRNNWCYALPGGSALDTGGGGGGSIVTDVSLVLNEWVRSIGGTKLAGENRSSRRETLPSATLAIKDNTGTDLGWNPGLRGERLSTTRLSYDGSLLWLKHKHKLFVDRDKCGVIFVLLAIDMVTSDLFGAPHTKGWVVEFYR